MAQQQDSESPNLSTRVVDAIKNSPLSRPLTLGGLAVVMAGCSSGTSSTSYTPDSLDVKDQVKYSTLAANVNNSPLTRSALQSLYPQVETLSNDLGEAFKALQEVEKGLAQAGTSDWLDEAGSSAKSAARSRVQTAADSVNRAATGSDFDPIHEDLVKLDRILNSVVSDLGQSASSSTWESSSDTMPPAFQNMTRAMEALRELRSYLQADLGSLRPGVEMFAISDINKQFTGPRATLDSAITAFGKNPANFAGNN